MECKVNFFSKRLTFTLCFILLNVVAFGQRSIEGKYSCYPGLGGVSVVLTKDYRYSFTTYTCMSTSPDTGIYSLIGDTIIFTSILTAADLENKKVTIGTTSAILEESKFVDTLVYYIVNESEYEVTDVKFYYKDKLIRTVQKIEAGAGQESIYKLPVNENSNSVKITVKVNDQIADIYKSDFVWFSIYTDRRKEKRPVTGTKMIIKNDKIYFIGNEFWSEDAFLKREN